MCGKAVLFYFGAAVLLAPILIVSVAGCGDDESIGPGNSSTGMFTGLLSNEQIDARYSTTGCFNHYTYEFAFHGGRPGQVDVYHVIEEWQGQDGWVEIDRDTLGTLILSGNDLRGLDRLIRYYQHVEGNGCTNVDDVSFRHYRDGELIEALSFTDATCRLYDHPEVLALTTLVRRFDQP